MKSGSCKGQCWQIIVIIVKIFKSMGGTQPLVKGTAEIAEHPRLGNIKLIKKENTETCLIEYEVPVSNTKEIDEWKKSLDTISNSQTREVLFLPISHQFERAGMCGSSGNLKLIFEDYLFLLQSEIINRAELGRPFLETEMWYLLYNLVRAGKQYERQDRKIGDVQPANIVINEDGQTKIISMDSWPGQQDNFSSVVGSRKKKVFLAPEQCIEQFIKKGEYPPGVNKNLAEAFSVGMTLLESASLKDCWQVYTKSGAFTVDQNHLKRVIESIRPQFSPYLVNSIQSLLILNPKLRPTCGQIHAVFAPYQNQIMNLDEFQFDPASSEKCLSTYQKFNMKGVTPHWTIKALLGNQQPVTRYWQGPNRPIV